MTITAGPISKASILQRSTSSRVVAFLLLAAALLAGSYMAASGLLAGYSSTADGGPDSSTAPPPPGTVPVTRGRLSLVLNQRGELACTKQSILASKVEWQTQLTSLIPEGTWVKAGDVVATLDVSKLKDEWGREQVDVLKAQTAVGTAEQNLRIQEIENRNAIIKAQTASDLARLSLEGYEQAEFPKEVSDLERQIAKSRDSLHSAEEQVEYVRRQVTKEFKTEIDLERERLSLMKARVDYNDLIERLRVLRKHTYDRRLNELQGLVQQTASTLEKQVALAKTQMLARQMQLDIQKRGLMRQQSQFEWAERMLSYCELRAPHDGQVVYAQTNGWQDQLAEGIKVRYLQPLVIIPDRTQMQIAVRIHESLRRLLAVGMQADIRLDSDPQHPLTGKVRELSSFPLTGRWPNEQLREYEAVVQLEGDCSNLTPGLSAAVNLVAASKADALQIPIAAVTEIGERYMAFVASGGSIEPRQVYLGESTRDEIEVVQGLKEGERVVLNPRDRCPDLVLACEQSSDHDRSGYELVAE